MYSCDGTLLRDFTMAATPEQIATWRLWLVEAERAYHDLSTGKSMVQARDSNGEEARYTAANASRLWAYIQWLKAQIAGSDTVAARRPLRPIFS